MKLISHQEIKKIKDKICPKIRLLILYSGTKIKVASCLELLNTHSSSKSTKTRSLSVFAGGWGDSRQDLLMPKHGFWSLTFRHGGLKMLA